MAGMSRTGAALLASILAVGVAPIFGGAGSARAQDVSVRAYLTPTTVGVGRTFVLNLERQTESVPEVPGYALRQVDPTTLEVDVTSERGVNDLFSALTEHGLRVASMRNKANRLEELFIRLVDSKQAPAEQSG